MQIFNTWLSILSNAMNCEQEHVYSLIIVLQFLQGCGWDRYFSVMLEHIYVTDDEARSQGAVTPAEQAASAESQQTRCRWRSVACVWVWGWGVIKALHFDRLALSHSAQQQGKDTDPDKRQMGSPHAHLSWWRSRILLNTLRSPSCSHTLCSLIIICLFLFNLSTVCQTRS